jgi:hypothetical protein
MPGNDSGLSKTRAIEPPGQRGILGGGLRGGGPGRPPFWRTPIKPRKGLGPVPLEIKTRHTLWAQAISKYEPESRMPASV